MICAFLHTDIHLEKTGSVLKWPVIVSERWLVKMVQVFLRRKNPVHENGLTELIQPMPGVRDNVRRWIDITLNYYKDRYVPEIRRDSRTRTAPNQQIR